jgi:nicotinamidase-related amidase
MTKGRLPVPPHFDPARVGEVWRTPYQQRASEAREWAKLHGIEPARNDHTTVGLLLVDCQNTFCIPGFELFVGGASGVAAVEDNVRLCRFIYENLGVITKICLTLDTHNPVQIFHPAFWIDDKGESPAPLTTITREDIDKGVWRPSPAAEDPDRGWTTDSLTEYARHYVDELARTGRYELIIWPYHAVIGGIGHAIVSAVEEAVFFHAIARNAAPRIVMKGENPFTEHYSALCPEVVTDHQGKAVATKNAAFLEELLGFDALIIAGQAKSHCVAFTVESLLSELQITDPTRAANVYLLEDCASPVVIPGAVDFTELADEAYRRFAQAGMRIVRSTDPMRLWPGMNVE